ncbi:alkaline phosphatase PhoX [Reichenbachiella sp. MSK19-1]|uniref:alkaline phosphatase PhoX n=1 Tax=Reichenbachiella sp. MSK19-1 TaxID=1897631 RepID=UPI000E6BA4A2|nr:alkaline phosphatase PhoX [Reichenbachiella sp. MSK19-1]RJE72007.1 phosphatase [Reichenbachiella sp. MSK19-1]
MVEKSRRSFIRQSAIVTLGFVALSRCSLSQSGKETARGLVGKDKGLLPDPKKYLDLPKGFSYRVISRSGERMDDGLLVPGRADGMGAFDLGEGKIGIVRNHENSPKPLENSPFGKNNENLDQFDSTKMYDAGNGKTPGLGGTTTLVYDELTGKVEQQYLSLAGTYRNCSGGMTPWGSWLTCEEDVTRAGGDIEKDHGFVFEVPVRGAGLVNPKPITAMGRFNHEAVAVDPVTHIVYQTEDTSDGLIYRFIPTNKSDLHAGGRLQVLAIKDHKSLDTRNWNEKTIKLRNPMDVEWLDIDDVLSPDDDLRLRGFKQGAARFARGEGMWFGQNELYFACTNGGPGKFGQVFRYRLSPNEGTSEEKKEPGKLELFAESESKTVLNMCDNLTLAPWGDVVLCEDNGDLNHIWGIDVQGRIYPIACNRSSTSELTGAVFSPSGKTLFVNVQENGDTLAITGPWEHLQSYLS